MDGDESTEREDQEPEDEHQIDSAQSLDSV